MSSCKTFKWKRNCGDDCIHHHIQPTYTRTKYFYINFYSTNVTHKKQLVLRWYCWWYWNYKICQFNENSFKINLLSGLYNKYMIYHKLSYNIHYLITWIWLWHILPVHRIEFPRKRRQGEHWPAFVIFPHSDNSRW